MVSFVYFDVGGVVVSDFMGTGKWEELKKELGIKAEDVDRFEKFWDVYEPRLNIGLDTDSLLPIIKKKFGTKLPETYSLLVDGFVDRFGQNKSIWPALGKIREKYRMGLLTNMYPGMLDAIRERGLLPPMKLDVVIDSSKVGAAKPDRKIFEIAEQRAGVRGHEILLVDNTVENTEAAEKFGWESLFYDSKNKVGANKALLARLD